MTDYTNITDNELKALLENSKIFSLLPENVKQININKIAALNEAGKSKLKEILKKQNSELPEINNKEKAEIMRNGKNALMKKVNDFSKKILVQKEGDDNKNSEKKMADLLNELESL